MLWFQTSLRHVTSLLRIMPQWGPRVSSSRASERAPGARAQGSEAVPERSAGVGSQRRMEERANTKKGTKMGERIDAFNQFRSQMNESILAEERSRPNGSSTSTGRLRGGALSAKTKELLGLTASMVLRCNDCITYHVLQCHERGSRRKRWRRRWTSPSSWRIHRDPHLRPRAGDSRRARRRAR
jgi:AhpD family alkylhydroperoxidase